MLCLNLYRGFRVRGYVKPHWNRDRIQGPSSWKLEALYEHVSICCN